MLRGISWSSRAISKVSGAVRIGEALIRTSDGVCGGENRQSSSRAPQVLFRAAHQTPIC